MLDPNDVSDTGLRSRTTRVTGADTTPALRKLTVYPGEQQTARRLSKSPEK